MNADGHIVLSVLERTVSEAAPLVERPATGCDLVEIRGDHLGADDVAALVRRCPAPTIVTVRTARDGGGFQGSEEERGRILAAGLAAGADFVDVEWGSGMTDLLRGEAAGRGILSHHGASCDRRELRDLRRAMSAEPAARLKIVPTARAVADLVAVRDLLLEQAGPPLACFAMGEAGALSRILALRWGSWATYGSPRPGRETAPGQFSVGDLDTLYDVRSIGPDTALYGLAGRGLTMSPSPAMHARGYRQTGIDARYLPLEIERFDEIDRLVDPCGTVGLVGFGVTVPHKEAAYRRCRRTDPWGEAAGAVNTVVPSKSGWDGFNTDAEAADRLLGELGSLEGRRGLVLGAGGTARAMAVVLRRRGLRVAVCNRDRNRAEAAASAIGADVVDWENRHGIRPDVLVQATPLGREGEVAVEPPGLPRLAVLDAVYGPEPTPLVREARRAGLLVVDGLDLLVGQGVLQFRRLTGRHAEPAWFRSAAEAFLAGRAAPS